MRSEQLIKTLTNDLKPVKVRSRRWLFALFALLFLGTAGAFSLVTGVRQNLASEAARVPFLLLQIQVVLVALGCAHLSARLAQPGRRPSRVALVFPFALSGIILADLVAMRLARVNEANWGPSIAGGLECLLWTSGLGAGLALAVLAIARTQATTYRAALGAVAGAGGIAAGALAIDFACANANPAHVGLWHVALPLVFITSLTVVLAGKLLRW